MPKKEGKYMPDMNDPEEIEDDILPDDSETLEKVDGSIIIDYTMLKDDVVMQTKEVANICGIGDPQTVRNLLQQWAPLLPVKRDENNRALWDKENIGKLQELLEVKKTHGYTVKQVLDHYLNPTPEMLNGEETGVIPANFDQNLLQGILKQVTAAVTGVMEQKFSEQMESLKAEIASLKETPRLPDESALEEARKDLEQAKMKLDQQSLKNNELQKSLDSINAENQELKDEIERLNKRKPLFGLWKKTD